MVRRWVERLEFFDLFNEVRFLIVELFVLGAVRVELGEEVDELVFVPQQNLEDRPRLVRVRNKHLVAVKHTILTRNNTGIKQTYQR